ncbi:MAG TPA: hypothetical protein VNN62_11895 [Methylomirabilota bacterium]|jgi:hypothetical protein|nr:hypothetical protein [Methylomirabilota bacterium]
MWSVMNYGPATAMLDFTSDFSVVLIGLVSVVGLSAAMITWSAIRHYKAQTQRPTGERSPLATDQQDAA